MFEPMINVLPEQTLGDVQIQHVDVSAHEAILDTLRGHPTSAGRFCVLRVGGRCMMSDTTYERRSNLDVVNRAIGDVLITGLGIGMVLVPVLRKPEVTRVTVVEHNANVIAVVEPALRRFLDDTPLINRLTVVHADAFTWRPGAARYDVIYHDIWPDICTDNLPEITRLKRRYARWLKPRGWQAAWVEQELRYRARRAANDFMWS